MKPTQSGAEFDGQPSRESWLDAVCGQVKSLRYGAVQIVVQDSKVVEIDKSEKIRLTPAAAK